MNPPDRSFADREVALVLRRAAEIEASEGIGTGGLSRSDILEVADEAGIGTDAVERALGELATEASVSGSSLFPASSRRASRSVPGQLGREDLARLIQNLEDRTGRPGSVTEALDTIRWTAHSTMRTTQVSFSSSDAGTRIGGHERISDRGKRLLYLMPANVLLLAGASVAGALALPGVATFGVAAGWAVSGLGIGRLLTGWFSKASNRRVESLVAELAEDARRAAGRLPEPHLNTEDEETS